MNEFKAINKIKYFQELIGDYETREDIDGLIDAIDLAITSLEKQVPKKPMSMQSREPEYMCTTCGFKFYGTSMTICLHCGQRLKWEV